MEFLHHHLIKVFYLSRGNKQLLMLAFDIFAVAISAFFTNWILSESFFNLPSLAVTVIVALALNAVFRLYSSVIRHISLKILFVTASAAVLTGLTFSTTSIIFTDKAFSLKSAIVLGLCFYVLISGVRLLVRSYYLYRHSSLKENIVIYGAGAAGQQLAASLLSGHEFNAVAFIDDNRKLHGTYLSDIKVYGFDEIDTVLSLHKPRKVFLALPSTSRRRRQKIISKLEPLRIEVQSIPGMADIISGKMQIDQVQDVSLDDLLGRDAVPPRPELFAANIKNKVVMVTGAGGSIGSELCRQIIRQKPKALLLFELSEYSLYAIEKELHLLCEELGIQIALIPLLGSVRKRSRMHAILSRYKVSTIYHAAAYKHVPLVEYNIIEGIQNNIMGTQSIVQAAIDAQVETFVLVSTDKAVRPTNVMGATKRFAELILQALSRSQTSTRICMVRFGNVLGSSGSVVPLFKKQITSGGPVTVTHKDITRYFMTIPEAAQLVIQAGAMGKGGDVFVLDMGKSVKIVDLAQKMIRLMGYEVRSEESPDGDIEITYTGLRPGEKLYEELLVGKNVKGTVHPRIMTADEEFLDEQKLNVLIDRLKNACAEFNFPLIREIIKQAPTGYSPSSEICDHLYKENIFQTTGTTNILDFPKG